MDARQKALSSTVSKLKEKDGLRASHRVLLLDGRQPVTGVPFFFLFASQQSDVFFLLFQGGEEASSAFIGWIKRGNAAMFVFDVEKTDEEEGSVRSCLAERDNCHGKTYYCRNGCASTESCLRFPLQQQRRQLQWPGRQQQRRRRRNEKGTERIKRI